MDTRTEYVEKLSAQIVEWDAQIDQLKIKSTSATPEARLEYSSTIEALRNKRDEAALKLQNIYRPPAMMNGKTSKLEQNNFGVILRKC